jgi:hypothetical protein
MSLGVEQQGLEADRLPTSSAEVKNGRAIPPTLQPPICLHGIALNELRPGVTFLFIVF